MIGKRLRWMATKVDMGCDGAGVEMLKQMP